MKIINLNFDGYFLENHKDNMPTYSGVYAVYRCVYNAYNKTVDLKEIIYIGQGTNVRKRISEHDRLPDFLYKCKDGETLAYSCAPVDKENLNLVENALIFSQKPCLNSDYVDNCQYTDARVILGGQCSLFYEDEIFL